MAGIPPVNEGAANIAKMTTGVASAVAAIWFPPAALAGPALTYAIDKFVERPKRLLIEQMKQGNFELLSDEQAAEFVPMAYKFLEAAKEGEYEHNLRILAAIIAGEMASDEPKALTVKRMAARIEGLEKRDLDVIALIKEINIDDGKRQFDNDRKSTFFSASLLLQEKIKKAGSVSLSALEVRASLAELASRGLLLADGATRLDKLEEYYDVQPSLTDLLHKAGKVLGEP